MRLFALVLALAAMPAVAADAPPPPPPPPPPSSDAPPAADVPPPPPSSEPAAAKGHSNWAKTGGIIGFVAGGVVLLLNVVNDFIGLGLHGDVADPPRFGADSAIELLPLAITAIAGPVAYAGGASARWTKSISGSRGLRIAGWIGYGASLLMQLIATGYWPWFRTLSGVVAAGALVCHGADALMSASEASDVAEMADADEGVQLRPVMSLLPAFGGRGGGASVGLAGTF